MELLRAATPLRLVSAMLGLAPYRHSHTAGLRRSRCGLAYSGLVLLSLIALSITSLTKKVLLAYATAKPATIVVDMGYSFTGNLMSMAAIVLHSTVNVSRFAHIMRQVAVVDRLLVVDTGPVYLRARWWLVAQIVAVTMAYTLLISGTCVFWFSEIYWYYVLGTYIPKLISTIITMQFMNFVLLIRRNFFILNRHLEQRPNAVCSHVSRTGRVEMVSSNIRHVSPCHEGDNVELRSLRKAHLLLCGMGDTVNTMFGFLVLVCLAGSFIALVAYMNMLLNIKQTSYHDNKPRYFILCYVTIMSAVELVCIIGPCHAASAQAERIKTLLSQLLIEEPPGGRGAGELKLFLQQVTTCRVMFTACGLFTIDLRFLFAFVGSLTGYLVIISQLK